MRRIPIRLRLTRDADLDRGRAGGGQERPREIPSGRRARAVFPLGSKVAQSCVARGRRRARQRKWEGGRAAGRADASVSFNVSHTLHRFLGRKSLDAPHPDAGQATPGLLEAVNRHLAATSQDRPTPRLNVPDVEGESFVPIN